MIWLPKFIAFTFVWMMLCMGVLRIIEGSLNDELRRDDFTNFNGSSNISDPREHNHRGSKKSF